MQKIKIIINANVPHYNYNNVKLTSVINSYKYQIDLKLCILDKHNTNNISTAELMNYKFEKKVKNKAKTS